MKRTVAIAMMVALGLTPLSAGAGAAGVIAGTMHGPAGPMAGVRVNALNPMGLIVGSATTNDTGSYALEGLPAGMFVVQAVSPSGTVLTTATASLSTETMRATTNLAAAAAAAAPAAQSAATTGGGMNAKAVWWIVGASAATAGIISAVALEDDPSPAQ